MQSAEPPHAHATHDHAHAGEHDHEHAHASAERRSITPRASSLTGTFTAAEAKQARRLTMVLALVAAFFVLEFAGARVARSVVLEADALHLLMDVLVLAMSLVAMRLAVRRPTARFTFGLRRAEPVAAIFNATLVLAATVEIVREAVEQLSGGPAPKANIMFVVACGALVVNGLSAWLLHGAIHAGHDHGNARDHEHDEHHDHGKAHDHDHDKTKGSSKKAHGHALNLRGAWLHVLGDALGSVAALVAALVIKFGGHSAADPIASFLVATILVLGALRLIRDAILVLLEAAPVHLPAGAIREVILGFPGVVDVHDLHVWTLGAGHDAITAHVRLKSRDGDAVVAALLSDHLRTRFEVEYVTVQIELTGDECAAPYRSA